MLKISEQIDILNKLEVFSDYQARDSEQLIIINNFSWQDYEKILLNIRDNFPFRLKYSNGVFQLMSPSRRHEIDKKMLGMLLETYFLARNIDFYPLGSTTFRKENVAKGIEPDQCYCFDSEKDFPDLAIEIIVTSGGVDSLPIYQALEVAEVWFWEHSQFSLYSLQNNSYQKVNCSLLLPDLDFKLLTDCLLSEEKPIDKLLAFKNRIELMNRDKDGDFTT
jgi:Uma2 family endonuclease